MTTPCGTPSHRCFGALYCPTRSCVNESTDDPNMSETNPSNHWDFLAKTLGATPSAEPIEPRQPVAPPVATRRERPKPPRAKPADWDKLANQLGLPPAATPSSPVKAETPEESPNYFDERYDFEEPVDLLDMQAAPASRNESSDETTDPSAKRPSKRRRRRGRGRSSDKRPRSSEPSDVEGSRESASIEEAASPSESQAPVLESDGETSDESSARRPRRRRGRKRRKPSTNAPSNASGAIGDAKEHPASERSRDRHIEDAADAEVMDAEEGEQPARLGFRGIPTWQETVGMLIDRNLEVRAKRGGGRRRP